MTLTRISLVTAAIAAILNAVVLLGWWALDDATLGAVNIAILAVGAVFHGWNNPNVKIIGKKA